MTEYTVNDNLKLVLTVNGKKARVSVLKDEVEIDYRDYEVDPPEDDDEIDFDVLNTSTHGNLTYLSMEFAWGCYSPLDKWDGFSFMWELDLTGKILRTVKSDVCYAEFITEWVYDKEKDTFRLEEYREYVM